MAYSSTNKSTDNFRIKLYTGNESARTITYDESTNMKPDLVWVKSRGHTASWLANDSIRGATQRLKIDQNSAQSTQTAMISAFDTNGFSLGTSTTANQNSTNFGSWSWLAGGTAPTKTYHVVVVSDSGNKYRFRDTADTTTFGASAVTLDLQEGGTYTFDVSDSTLNSHPFVIGTAANGTEYSTGVTYKLDGVTKTYSQYTSGFSAATSRQLVITLAASAPALYYWCSAHSGMGGAINTNATHGSSNFDGLTQSTVSTNSATGMSIIKYNGTGSQTTIGHELGGVPDWIVIKRLGSAEDWASYHVYNGAGTYQSLNTTEPVQSNANRFNVTPTSTVFTVNTHESVNYDEDYIAYCFKAVPGFSSFGWYEGNGSTSGPFVNTGMKPTCVIRKCVTSGTAEAWVLQDNQRPGYNITNLAMFPSGTNVEDTAAHNAIDFLSNGFRAKSTDTRTNGDSKYYIYMAFGQTVVGSNNVPATAG